MMMNGREGRPASTPTTTCGSHPDPLYMDQPMDDTSGGKNVCTVDLHVIIPPIPAMIRVLDPQRSRSEALPECCFSGGPTSATPAHHWDNILPTPGVRWDGQIPMHLTRHGRWTISPSQPSQDSISHLHIHTELFSSLLIFHSTPASSRGSPLGLGQGDIRLVYSSLCRYMWPTHNSKSWKIAQQL